MSFYYQDLAEWQSVLFIIWTNSCIYSAVQIIFYHLLHLVPQIGKLTVKEEFDILGNTLTRFLAQSELWRSTPLSCLYVKYEFTDSSQLA